MSSHPLRDQTSLFDAVVESHSAIGVAAQIQAGMARQPILDPGHALEMTEMILGNGTRPADDVMKDGGRLRFASRAVTRREPR